MGKRSRWWTVAAVALCAGPAAWEALGSGSSARNPRGTRGRIQAARRLWEGFHWGRPATTTRRANVTPAPRTLVELGELEEVTYRTKKGRDRTASYVHQFGEEGGRRPVLAMDLRKRLHIVGGDYTVTDRGIED